MQVLSSAVLAALVSANAQAVLPTIDPATTTTLYVAGASAQRTYIQEAITGSPGVAAADKICDTTQPIWWWADNVSGAAGKNHDAWYCTKSSSNTALANAKTHLLIYKRSAGGSDYGVSPIINSTSVGFLNIANSNCTEGATTGGVTAALCSASTLAAPVVPDLGVSDVDPGQFVGENVTTGFSAVKSTDLAKLFIKSTSTVVFGEQVTANLFKALQAAQLATGQIPATCTVGDHTEACLPTLSSAVIAAIHTGDVFDWDLIQVGNTGLGLYSWTVANAPAYQPSSSAVHIARRANGSGTQTQHGIVFLNYPCDTAAANATVAVNDKGQSEAVEGFVVHEGSSAGNVNAILNALDTATASPALVSGTHTSQTTWTDGVRWAVGLNSLEQVTSATTNYEFVKVDGVAPTLANVVAGKYHDWVENTFQYNNSGAHPVTTDVAAVRDAIMSKVAHPGVLTGLNSTLTHVFGNGAYLADPEVYTPSVIYNSSNPVNVFSRSPAGTGTDDCRVPTPYNDGVNLPSFNL